MEIIQIAGYKNSGKTTLAMAFIAQLSNEGVKVASLKHHGHGGVPLGLEKTDSAMHQQAGAVMSGVEGDGVFQLAIKKPWDVEKMLAVYKVMDIEVVIMEGFKQHDYNKVVLVRKEEELHLLNTLTNIKAVVTPLALKQDNYPYPIFKRTEIGTLVERMTRSIQKQRQKRKEG